MVRKAEQIVDLSHFTSFNIMSRFIYTDLFSSLLNPRHADPGSTLIHVGAYGPYSLINIYKQFRHSQYIEQFFHLYDHIKYFLQ